MLVFPGCTPDEIVARRSFLAIMNGYRIRIRFISLKTGMGDWLRVRPHALGHDGCHWHLRAWSERSDDFEDFPLRQITEVEWGRDLMDLPRPDKDWNAWTVVRARPRANLPDAHRQMVGLDYGMSDGLLEMRVRKAMEPHLRRRLGFENGSEANTMWSAAVLEPA